MKASEFLRRFEQQQKEQREGAKGEPEQDHSLRAQAWEHARHPEQMKVGTPFDWEELEAYQKELERLEREGPGRGADKNNSDKK